MRNFRRVSARGKTSEECHLRSKWSRYSSVRTRTRKRHAGMSARPPCLRRADDAKISGVATAGLFPHQIWVFRPVSWFSGNFGRYSGFCKVARLLSFGVQFDVMTSEFLLFFACRFWFYWSASRFIFEMSVVTLKISDVLA